MAEEFVPRKDFEDLKERFEDFVKLTFDTVKRLNQHLNDTHAGFQLATAFPTKPPKAPKPKMSLSETQRQKRESDRH
ncbi:MAG TPA: hypothetical protein VG055_18830 [Planctomycetaceae bacterium]|jgi:hypothetical protein|nr:hypothetical protein [Planctomycetaceae bacterium]